jgi:hypothetical protein
MVDAIRTAQSFGPDAGSILMNAVSGRVTNDAATSTRGSKRVQRGGVRPGAKHVRVKRANHEEPQSLPRASQYLSENDWQKIRDKGIPVAVKLALIANRLGKWGVKHLDQDSRREPVAILLSQHYGLASLGTPSCTYRKLYEHTRDLYKMCLHGTDADNAPCDYITEYKDNPGDMPEALRNFAEDPDDPIVTAEIADLAQCAAAIPLRENNRHLVAEEKRGAMPALMDQRTRPPVQDRMACRRMDTCTDDDLREERCRRGAIEPLGGWRPANNFPALTWESPAPEESPPPSFKLGRLKPAFRTYAGDNSSHSDSYWTGPSDSWAKSTWNENDAWEKYDSAKWDGANDGWHASTYAQEESNKSVSQYEAEMLGQIDEKKRAAAERATERKKVAKIGSATTPSPKGKGRPKGAVAARVVKIMHKNPQCA